ncbi:unnamed protein product [Caenorhabditis bovis]|uniref:Serpentine receptor class gamma n=1 Tax=Caenorhabditis bovis TaxID=2654633 RepID=A0A8S1EHI3_9PELO|nr:unnamed protein product [Caenorhabditis bovis]
MGDDMIMRKNPEAIELQFHDSGESTLIKSKILADLQSSPWEAAVREEIKKQLSKSDDDMTAKELFDAVKDMARREVPTDIKKRLYEQILEVLQVDLLVNIFCYLNTWPAIRISEFDTGIKYLVLFEQLLPGVLTFSGFLCQCTIVSSPFWMSGSYAMSVTIRDGALVKFVNKRVSSLIYMVNPLFAMFYFSMTICTGVLTAINVSKSMSKVNSKRHFKYAQKLTNIVIANGIIMSGNLMFTIFISLGIIFHKEYRLSYLILSCTSDMVTLAMPYILLIFDRNVKRLFGLSKKPGKYMHADKSMSIGKVVN